AILEGIVQGHLSEIGVSQRCDSVVRQVCYPRAVIKYLGGDLARRLVPLQLDDDQIAALVKTEEVDEAAKAGLHLSPDHEQVWIENRDVACKPTLEPPLQVKGRLGQLGEFASLGDPPEANFSSHSCPDRVKRANNVLSSVFTIASARRATRRIASRLTRAE